ncbi:MAG: (2Fe-2S)-binding protein [Ferrovibrio sp.]|uniref:(2Fe-2S)-binding protein n=1 Tax=Ferrovibrio sp. TaxID=1917215 RepID=UPI00391B97F5
MQLSVNGRTVVIPDARAGDPLLWVLREHLGLVGTKFGCGQGLCGACTIHVGGTAVRSCQIAAADAAGQAIVTIEGLAGDDGVLHPVQQAWIEESVPQCGYCQAGQIMSAAALLQATPRPDDAAIDAAMAGNLCRCGTYARIRKAILRAGVRMEQKP